MILVVRLRISTYIWFGLELLVVFHLQWSPRTCSLHVYNNNNLLYFDFAHFSSQIKTLLYTIQHNTPNQPQNPTNQKCNTNRFWKNYAFVWMAFVLMSLVMRKKNTQEFALGFRVSVSKTPNAIAKFTMQMISLSAIWLVKISTEHVVSRRSLSRSLRSALCVSSAQSLWTMSKLLMKMSRFLSNHTMTKSWMQLTPLTFQMRYSLRRMSRVSSREIVTLSRPPIHHFPPRYHNRVIWYRSLHPSSSKWICYVMMMLSAQQICLGSCRSCSSHNKSSNRSTILFQNHNPNNPSQKNKTTTEIAPFLEDVKCSIRNEIETNISQNTKTPSFTFSSSSTSYLETVEIWWDCSFVHMTVYRKSSSMTIT